jgi:NAD(P)H-dependent flavin oxidoreductase YrpB (nitropropane dioxygenase family)
MSASTGASPSANRSAFAATVHLRATAPFPARLSASAPFALPSFTPRPFATASAFLARREVASRSACVASTMIAEGSDEVIRLSGLRLTGLAMRNYAVACPVRAGVSTLNTSLCNILGIKVPIIQAPMGGTGFATRLAAAVCNAGGLGMLHLWRADLETLRSQIRELRSLTDRPFAVNLNLEFPQAERLDACLDERVPVISFFWGDPTTLAPRAKAAGAVVLHTVGAVRDAAAAVECGVDVVVAQGWEAGGHVRGKVATMALVPAVVDAVAPVPVVAAGGIADGRGMAAALALGASGVWIGTRFLASKEVALHPHYLDRLLRATADDTVYLENLYDIGWPDAPHRVLRNQVVANWEAAGRPTSGKRPGEGEIVARSPNLGDIVQYRPCTATADIDGDIEALSLWAGQGVGLVTQLQPAAEILHQINDEATKILKHLASLGK